MHIKNWFICFTFAILLTGTATLHAQFENGKVIDFTRYRATNDSTSITTILTTDSLFKKHIPDKKRPSKKDAYWLKIDFSEKLQELENDTLWFLYTRNFYKSTLYYQDKETISNKKYGFLNREKINIKNQPTNGVFFNKNNLINGQFLLLKITNLLPNQNFENYQIKYLSYEDYSTE